MYQWPKMAEQGEGPSIVGLRLSRRLGWGA
jgi:hypothetical protein